VALQVCLWETACMPKRNLRIVKRTPSTALGICEYCNKQFESRHPDEAQAEKEITSQFNCHICWREDFNQAAARVVRESTEDK